MKEIIEKAEEMLLELTKDGIDRPTLEVIKKKADQAYWAHTPKESKREYFSFKECASGYYYILENNCSAQEAIKYIKDLYDKSDNYVDTNKSRECFYVRRLVKIGDEHPIQRKLIKSGILYKNVLSSANTLNQLYRRLSKFVQVYYKVCEAQGVKRGVLQQQADSLHNCTTFSQLNKKQKASLLKCLGLTQQGVADSIGVTKSTVTRWWKEI
jgi:hypothetical protein